MNYREEEVTFQRKKLLVFAGLAAVAGLILWTNHLGEIWTNHLGEKNSENCIRCQQQLTRGRLDSLTVIGSLLTKDSTYETYYRTIRNPQLLVQLALLSQPGPPLQLSGTNLKLSTHGLGLHWYQRGSDECQLDAAQTQAGRPYTDCYGNYQFTAHPRLIPMLDSLLQTQPDGRW